MHIGGTWFGLPWEIRQSILVVIARVKHPGWASLASVCTEWRSVIETENLRQITLGNDDIHHLPRMITQDRRDRVQHIRLNISLLLYDCSLCQEHEDLIDVGLNTGLVIASIYRVLRVLSSWPSRPAGKGIKLELNAYSDSDYMHWYKHYYYGAPMERLKFPVGIAACSDRHQLRDTPFVPALYHPFDLQLDIDAPQTSIRRLVIFENINGELSDALNEIPGYSGFEEVVMPIITEAFAWLSVAYEVIWVWLLFDAKVFFSYCFEAYNWPQLRSLCLTSPTLNSGSPAEAAALMREAARIAMRMPVLDTLVLWNGEEQGQACAFVYRKSNEGPSITWRGTWDIGLYLTSEVVDAWKAVVSQTGWQDLSVCFERVEERICYMGDAIYYLRLPCQVIEPQSLWEMRREERTIVPSSLTEVE
ncbi:hypothetical protein BBK36DRAFT_1166529 [Trichoderma citrinoviride]|uniref:DUF6546 domain-containing protein n=1 Tax=Trichoderma citrinoviride TaxID=58853 RepID=A0A2T4BH79_9HYPO|nr:hypothetical protein BBK36DRAFT_1166529 [Trichoderma citrinoviride]PTB68628.1 hypothetical protein BBK36DRAFT_1166529 [Trichoderma citrinoviride]